MIAKEYIPEYCVWELTLRCNMRCLHCGSTAGRAREGELALHEWMPVADELVGLGCRCVTLIGGEVFLAKDWEKLARHLSDAGVEVNIITNGAALREPQIEQIQAANLANVCVSIDGMREHHDHVRNVNGSFERAVGALDRLSASGISTGVVTTLLAENINDLEALYSLLIDHGVSVWQLQIATPMGNMAEAKGMLLDPSAIPRVTRFIREHRDPARLWILAGDDIGYYDENEAYLRNLPGRLCAFGGCSAGLTAVGIDSVGNVKGCESLYDPRFIEGNVRTESFTAIWTKKGNFAYNRNFDPQMLAGRCKGCDKGSLCRGGCRGSCYFNSDGMYENPYCCYPGRPIAPEKRHLALAPEAAIGLTPA
ncbi:MAG: radical SAM protein [Polyangiaceae bacterium]|nr:radical SAM protein [Polyangiaceae bacterium]